jgi:hypothetical protein
MNKTIAEKFMKTIEQVLKFPAQNSIFTNNINPIRVALMLYGVVHEVDEKYQYSEQSTLIMKKIIIDTLKNALESY